MNCRMPELKRAFEAAGFKDVKTLLSSGNVTFEAPKAAESTIREKAHAAMKKVLGQEFLTIVRPVDELRKLLASDPFARFKLAPGSKRVVTFLQSAPPARIDLPIERDGARVLALEGREAFTVYVATPKGPVFMTLIGKAFGKEQTTRTWQTVEKVAR